MYTIRQGHHVKPPSTDCWLGLTVKFSMSSFLFLSLARSAPSISLLFFFFSPEENELALTEFSPEVRYENWVKVTEDDR